MTHRIKLFIISISLIILTLPSLAQEEALRQNAVPVNCGAIVESEFTVNHAEDRFTIELEAGASFNANIRPFGQGLSTTLSLYGPTNLPVVISDGVVRRNDTVQQMSVQIEPAIRTETLGAGGTYTIRVTNFSPVAYDFVDDEYINIRGSDTGGIGIYTLFIGCTLSNGTVVQPGDAIPTPPTSEPPTPNQTSGFLFPTMFDNAIPLPLQLGQTQTIPLASDVALYTYEALSESIHTLTIARVNGDTSIGVIVTSQATDEIIFIGGMPTSNNLTVDLSFPSAGVYNIALFRLDTPQHTGTSGAVQLTLE